MNKHRPAWLPACAALFFGGLTLALGVWQLNRADYKRALQARFDQTADLAPIPLRTDGDPEAMLFRRVRVQGRFDAARQIYLDNRMLDGRAGYHVITPLIGADGGAVLINRGWLAATPQRDPPHAPPPAGEVTVEGVAMRAQQRYFELSPSTVAGAVWQNLDLARFRTQLAVPDLLVLQDNPAAGVQLLHRWPRPDAGAAMHQGYAVQWFALTATIAVLWLRFGR